MSIQEALKILRLELGWTQTDLAEKINKTYITVNRWENGKSFPSRANARDILEAAKDGNASDDCIAYLNEVLLPDCKRGQTGGEYGFPEIDRDFSFQIADNSANIAYVVEAKTHTMLYANRTAEKLISRIRAKSGNANEESRLEKNKDRRCFHYLLNKTEPCSFCPLIHTKNLTSWDGIQTSSESGKTYLHEKEVYIIYLLDISSLAQERMALYQMTNDIPNGVGIYNVYLDGRKELVFMNSAYYKMIGEARKEQWITSFTTDMCLVHPDDKKKLNIEIEQAIIEKRNVDITIRMFIRDKQYHLVHISGRMIKKDREKFLFYCVFTEKA